MNLILIVVGLALTGAGIVVGGRRVERQREVEATLSARLLALEPSLGGDATAIPVAAALRLPVPDALKRMLARADITIRFDVIGGLAFLLLLAAAVTAYVAGIVAGALVLAGGIGFAVFVLDTLGSRRISALTEALPHLLDGIRQLLAASYSFQQAFLKAVDETSPAVRRYLEPAQRRIHNGASTAEALSSVAERVDCAELHMLAAAVRVNARFGGPIAPMLTGLAAMLRNRTRIGQELRAATAEIRMSGTVLTWLPPVAAVLMTLINRDYMSFLWTTDAGRRLAIIAIVLEIVGVMLMRRLMKVVF